MAVGLFMIAKDAGAVRVVLVSFLLTLLLNTLVGVGVS